MLRRAQLRGPDCAAYRQASSARYSEGTTARTRSAGQGPPRRFRRSRTTPPDAERRLGVGDVPRVQPGQGDGLRRRLGPGTERVHAPLAAGDGSTGRRRKVAGDQGGQRRDLLVWRGLSDDLHKWVRG